MSKQDIELDKELEEVDDIAELSPALAESRDLVVQAEGIPQVPAFWGGTEAKWIESVKRAGALISSRHGFLSQVPIICKGRHCPFAQACYIPEDERVVGKRCPIEVATVIELYRRYCNHFGIDPDNPDLTKYAVDISLINQLVELEVKLVRAQMKLAIDADFVQEVAIGSTEDGDVITKPEIHQAESYEEKLRKDIQKIMDILLSTRKAKQIAGMGRDPSSKASSLMAQVREMVESGQVDQSMIALLFQRKDSKGDSEMKRIDPKGSDDEEE